MFFHLKDGMIIIFLLYKKMMMMIEKYMNVLLLKNQANKYCLLLPAVSGSKASPKPLLKSNMSNLAKERRRDSI